MGPWHSPITKRLNKALLLFFYSFRVQIRHGTSRVRKSAFFFFGFGMLKVSVIVFFIFRLLLELLERFFVVVCLPLCTSWDDREA